MKKQSKSHHGSLSELNITPLLDLAFVLLVIFIITTPQLSNDLEMNLPSPKQQNKPAGPPPKIHRIVVEASGQIQLNGQLVQSGELKPTLLALRHSETNPTVVVRGSGDADYQKVIVVLDALQQTAITNVGLATEVAQ